MYLVKAKWIYGHLRGLTVKCCDSFCIFPGTKCNVMTASKQKQPNLDVGNITSIAVEKNKNDIPFSINNECSLCFILCLWQKSWSDTDAMQLDVISNDLPVFLVNFDVDGTFPRYINYTQPSCWGWGGGYIGFTSVCLSVPSSINLSHIPCPLCSAYSSGWIHFIFLHIIKQFEKVCCV